MVTGERVCTPYVRVKRSDIARQWTGPPLRGGHTHLSGNDDLTVARVDHEGRLELGRLRVAGIVAHLVMITPLLHPALASRIRTLGLVVHFAPPPQVARGSCDR